jgi:hypothetical protein
MDLNPKVGFWFSKKGALEKFRVYGLGSSKKTLNQALLKKP